MEMHGDGHRRIRSTPHMPAERIVGATSPHVNYFPQVDI